MTEIIRKVELSRRGFLAGSGALVVAVTFGGKAGTVFGQALSGRLQPTAYVGIEPGGRITILYGKAEMGQGVLTGLPVIVAEFMDAKWDDVVIERAAGIGAITGQYTVGSNSTSGQWNNLRRVGAQVRAVLLRNAAERLGVPVEELITRPSLVVHERTGRSMTYGEIASFATVSNPLPEFPDDVLNTLKAAKDFRIIGTNVPRADVPGKVDGTAVFGIDIDLPGMVYGAILRAPVGGEAPVNIVDTAARAVPGVIDIVRTPYAVGVVAASLHQARQAVAALQVTWTETSPVRKVNSDAAIEAGIARIADATAIGVFQGQNNNVGEFAKAARIETLEFRTNHVAHACMEPMNATVLKRADGTFEVWAGTQNPDAAALAVRSAAGLAKDAVVAVNVTLLGGGFGRRIEAEHIADAAYLANAVPGRPVKVVWTREDDLRYDPYRPLTAQRIEAALDENNNIIGWRHRIAAGAYAAGSTISADVGQTFDRFDFIAAGGGGFPYRGGVAPRATEYFFLPTVKVGAWRAIGAAYMKYPVETMIDHIADIRKEDPVAFRLSMLNESDPRQAAAARIIRLIAERSGWARYVATPGRALGIGYSDALNSHTACVADVSADRGSGRITIHKIWCAIDCGIAVLPVHVHDQCVSSILYSLGPTLFEQVRIENGIPQVRNLSDYRVVRQMDVPEIEVLVSPRGGVSPTGVGEAAVSPLVPAVTNAVRRALGGVHLGYLPLLPDKVLEAIRA